MLTFLEIAASRSRGFFEWVSRQSRKAITWPLNWVRWLTSFVGTKFITFDWRKFRRGVLDIAAVIAAIAAVIALFL